MMVLYKTVFWSSVIRALTAISSLIFFWFIGKNKIDIETYSQIGVIYSLVFLLDLGYFKSIRNRVTNESAYSLYEVLINSSMIVVLLSIIISFFLKYKIPVFLFILLRYINSTSQDYFNSKSRQTEGQIISFLGMILSILLLSITGNLVRSLLLSELFIAIFSLSRCTFEVRASRLYLSLFNGLKGVDILMIQILLLSFIPFDRYILLENPDYDISHYEIILRLSGMIFFPINVLQLFLWTESAKRDKNINPFIVLKYSFLVVIILALLLAVLAKEQRVLSSFFPTFEFSPEMLTVLGVSSLIVLVSLQTDILFGYGKRNILLKLVAISVSFKLIIFLVFKELIFSSFASLLALSIILYYEICRTNLETSRTQ